MKEEVKKELIKLIDDIAKCRDQLSSLEDRRRKATAELDKKISELYNEVQALEEKKRVVMLSDDSNNGAY